MFMIGNILYVNKVKLFIDILPINFEICEVPIQIPKVIWSGGQFFKLLVEIWSPISVCKLKS